MLGCTGLRVGETMQLLWSDVNLATGQLTIRPETDKSKRGRVIPLSPFLLSELEGWGLREGFIVPKNGNGNRARQPAAGYMTHRWKKAGVRAAGVHRRSAPRLWRPLAEWLVAHALPRAGAAWRNLLILQMQKRGWWRRRESNPGPKMVHVGVYMLSP